MKITIGGSVSMTLQPKQYESINAMSIFTMEKEYPDDISAQKIEAENDKINKIILKELNKRLKSAFIEYREKRGSYKSLITGY